MLDLIKNALLFRDPSCLKFQSQLKHATDLKQLANELIQSIYYPQLSINKDSGELCSEEILRLFFIIPKSIEGLSDEHCLTFFRHITTPLVAQLLWVKRAIGLDIQRQTMAEQQLQIEFYINQFNQCCDNPSNDSLKIRTSNQKHPENLDSLSFTFLHTMIAYTSLDYIQSIVLKKFPKEEVMLAELERAINACFLLLSSETLSINVDKKYRIIGAIFNLFLLECLDDAPFEVPAYFEQIKNQFKKLKHYTLIKHCIMLNTVYYYLEIANNYNEIEPLLIEFSKDNDRPLIYIFNIDPTLIRYILMFIFSTGPDPQKISEKLMLIFTGLTPIREMPSTPETPARFRFLLSLYRDYVTTERERHQKEGLLALLINLCLEEEGHSNSPFIQHVMPIAFTSNHIGFTLAFFLSSINKIDIAKKKELFSLLIKTTDSSLGVYLNLWNLLHHQKLPAVLEVKILEFLVCFTDEACFYEHQKLHQLLNHFNDFLTEYWKPQPIVEKMRLESKITNFSIAFINVIDRAKNDRLSLLIKSMLNCHQSYRQSLLLFFINAPPLSNVFRALLNDGSAIGPQSNPCQAFKYEENNLIKISTELCKSDREHHAPHLIEALLSSIDAELSAVILLLLLILVSQNNDSGIIPKQSKWFKWTLSLIKEITINHPQTNIGKAMFHFTKLFSIKTFLPREQQRAFLESTQPIVREEPMASVDDIVAELEKSLIKQPSKKQKKTPANQSIEAIEPAEKKKPTPLLSPIKQPEIVPEKPAKTSPLKSLELSETSSKKQIELEDSAALSELKKSLTSSLRKINVQMDKMQHIKLPTGFRTGYRTVEQSLRSIQALLSPAPTSESTPPTTEKKATYSSLTAPSKLKLEEDWNKELAIFCYDIQIKLNKSLDKRSKKESAEYHHLIKTITCELASLSHCYFKNPKLHFPEAIIRCLSVIKTHYQTENTRVAMKGNFAFPKEADDLDLVIIPDTPVEQKEINDKFTALSKAYGTAVISGKIFQNEELLSHQVDIVIPFEPEINLDLNFLKHPLSPIEELHKTALAFLSPCAIHWYFDGHACMQPQTARAICCDKPVLKLLSPLKSIEEQMHLIGYIIKNVIKYNDILYLDQHIKKLMKDYINPDSRDAALPTIICRDEIEKNQKIIGCTMEYLLNRLSSRTTKTIRFILEKQLLRVLFPLHEQQYPLYAQYFTTHFFPVGAGHFPSKISGPAFLSMFFIGALVDKPIEKQQLFIEGLKKLPPFDQKSLKESMAKSIAILESIIPLTTDKLSTQPGSAFTTPGKFSFATETLKLIFSLWHPEGLPPQEKPQSPLSDRLKNPETRGTTPSPTSPVASASASYPQRFLAVDRGLTKPMVEAPPSDSSCQYAF